MSHPESKIQAAIVQALQAMGVFVFSVPNEAAGRNKRAMVYLKAMGLRSGVADLIAVLPGRIVFLEVKTPPGKQSKSQKHFQRTVEELGHAYHVVRSVDDAVSICT